MNVLGLGSKIEGLLKENEITQRELAKRIGIDETTVSRIIKEERMPKAEVIANIATALHTTSDYLLGIEKDDFDSNKIIRLIARNSSKMSIEQKKKIINALLEEE